MIYTEMTKKALKLSFAAHKNQLDKGGMPYVYHPFHLAEQMQTEDTVIVALLHDVVEDTACTLQDIAHMGFSQTVVDALACMTHDPCVPYLQYIARLSENPVAKTVKLADLRHNSDLSRLDNVDEYALQRVQKYQSAIELLTATP